MITFFYVKILNKYNLELNYKFFVHWVQLRACVRAHVREDIWVRYIQSCIFPSHLQIAIDDLAFLVVKADSNSSLSNFVSYLM